MTWFFYLVRAATSPAVEQEQRPRARDGRRPGLVEHESHLDTPAELVGAGQDHSFYIEQNNLYHSLDLTILL
jgi:hypothetical protein